MDPKITLLLTIGLVEKRVIIFVQFGYEVMDALKKDQGNRIYNPMGVISAQYAVEAIMSSKIFALWLFQENGYLRFQGRAVAFENYSLN